MLLHLSTATENGYPGKSYLLRLVANRLINFLGSYWNFDFGFTLAQVLQTTSQIKWEEGNIIHFFNIALREHDCLLRLHFFYVFC